MALTPYNVWLPLFALGGFAVVAPITWGWILPELSTYDAHIQLLGSLVPVILMLLLGASWLDPGRA